MPMNDGRITNRARVDMDAVLTFRRPGLRRREPRHEIRITNVSVAGLAVVAREEIPPRYSDLRILVGTSPCDVQVKNHQVGEDGLHRYGLELVEPSPEFIQDLITGTELDRFRRIGQTWQGPSHS
jgi:hypothetical protein